MSDHWQQLLDIRTSYWYYIGLIKKKKTSLWYFPRQDIQFNISLRATFCYYSSQNVWWCLFSFFQYKYLKYVFMYTNNYVQKYFRNSCLGGKDITVKQFNTDLCYKLCIKFSIFLDCVKLWQQLWQFANDLAPGVADAGKKIIYLWMHSY